jgi:hypothetical protein
VAEVFVGLLEGDQFSFLSAAPRWKPTFGKGGDFELADLLTFAGVASKPVEGPPANTVWTA